LIALSRTFPLLACFALVGTGCIASTEDAEGDSSAATDPSEAVGVEQQAVSAPSCISFLQYKYNGNRVATARNDCGTNQRFRMIWRWAGDGPCTTLNALDERTEYRSLAFRKDPYVTELRKC
jgi:hypothetical protein